MRSNADGLSLDARIWVLIARKDKILLSWLMGWLQIITPNKWVMNICDFEGAFLRGIGRQRSQGKIYFQDLKDGIPGVEPGSIVEVRTLYVGFSCFGVMILNVR